MSLLDWILATVILVSGLAAARTGLVVQVCSLGGAIVGLLVACWDYQRLTPWVSQWIHTPAAARVAAFLLIALGIMIAAGILGRIVRWSLRTVGLGWLDRLAGALFGLVRGVIIALMLIVALTAFAPRTHMLVTSRMAPYFMAAAHAAAIASPRGLDQKIHEGINILHGEQSKWFAHSLDLP